MTTPTPPAKLYLIPVRASDVARVRLLVGALRHRGPGRLAWHRGALHRASRGVTLGPVPPAEFANLARCTAVLWHRPDDDRDHTPLPDDLIEAARCAEELWPTLQSTAPPRKGKRRAGSKGVR